MLAMPTPGLMISAVMQIRLATAGTQTPDGRILNLWTQTPDGQMPSRQIRMLVLRIPAQSIQMQVTLMLDLKTRTLALQTLRLSTRLQDTLIRKTILRLRRRTWIHMRHIPIIMIRMRRTLTLLDSEGDLDRHLDLGWDLALLRDSQVRSFTLRLR